jgi:hypothetical protein
LVLCVEQDSVDREDVEWTVSVETPTRENEGTKVTFSARHDGDTVSGAPVFHNIVLRLVVEVSEEGLHHVNVRQGTEVMASVPLWIRKT